MTRLPYPAPENGFVHAHARLLCASYRHFVGRSLIDSDPDDLITARRLFEAPFAVLSHGADPDPILTYANRTALALFELDWDRLIRMPSRLTAEAPDRAERARLLARVAARGFVEDYRGVRISSRGRRFAIEAGVVWNLLDDDGRTLGQAAAFEPR